MYGGCTANLDSLIFLGPLNDPSCSNGSVLLCSACDRNSIVFLYNSIIGHLDTPIVIEFLVAKSVGSDQDDGDGSLM